jgi:hypothetical protein
MIVAWHEVPGTAPPQKSRPVGYGLIVQVCAPIRRLERKISNAVSLSRIEMIPKMYLWDRLRPIIPYPAGRFFRWTLSQALRAWLPSACPFGTKAIRPSKGLALSERLWGKPWPIHLLPLGGTVLEGMGAAAG